MSYSNPNPPQPNPPAVQATSPTLANLATVLVIPLVVVVGLFVLIALGKLDASVGVPIIATIGGVHGGAVIANSSSSK